MHKRSPSSQRRFISLVASLQGMELFTRDITQVYIQCQTFLETTVYIEAPQEMRLPPGTVLHVVNPLYQIPNNRPHWYLTYFEHHVGGLGMQRARTNHFVFMRRNRDSQPDGLINIPVEEKLAYGFPTFMRDEKEAAVFNPKRRNIPSNAQVSFNCTDRGRQNKSGNTTISQKKKIKCLKIEKRTKELSIVPTFVQYVGLNTRSEVCAPVQQISQRANRTATEEEYISL